MDITKYVDESRAKTVSKCNRAIRRLKQEIALEVAAHVTRLSMLEKRVKDCNDTIARLRSS